jgi:nucleoside-diphosphate-sugar epimerase
MDIAITGAGGFIGSNMTRRLAEQGHNVLAVDRRKPKDQTRIDSWALAHEIQLVSLQDDQPDLAGIDCVYHFAADMGGVGYFHNHDFWPYIVNTRIDCNVLQAMIDANVPRGFVASSACVYPTEIQRYPHKAPRLYEALVETGTPDQMYGRAKLMLLRLAERAPVDIRVGILHTVYGTGQEREGERMKFPTAIATKTLAARDTGTVEIWGDGHQLRSYLWIDDALAKIEALTMDPVNIGPTNIGYDGAVSVREIARLCAKIVGIEPQYTYTLDKPSGVLSRDCDNTKFWEQYGRMEPTAYADGFTKLLEWLVQSGDN